MSVMSPKGMKAACSTFSSTSSASPPAGRTADSRHGAARARPRRRPGQPSAPPLTHVQHPLGGRHLTDPPRKRRPPLPARWAGAAGRAARARGRVPSSRRLSPARLPLPALGKGGRTHRQHRPGQRPRGSLLPRRDPPSPAASVQRRGLRCRRSSFQEI